VKPAPARFCAIIAAFALAGPAPAAEAIKSIVSAAVESSHVFCTGPCFLRSAYVTSGASAGYVLSYNLTAAPSNGAVTPTDCVVLPANSTVSLDFGDTQDVYPVGLTLAFSTTGCFTQTLSATAYFKARKQ
jgi:hypothetical protein